MFSDSKITGIENGFSEIEFNKDELHEGLVKLKHQYQFNVLLSIFAEDQIANNNQSNRICLSYLLLNIDKNIRLRIKLQVSLNTVIKSVKEIFSNSTWFEAEISDMYGIFFSGNNLKRVFSPKNWKGHALLKDYQPTAIPPLEELHIPLIDQSKKFRDKTLLREWVTLNPGSPIGGLPFELNLKLYEENVEEVQMQFGFYHRGFEKNAELKKYWQLGVLVERLNFETPFLSSLSWFLTLEKHLGIVPPEKAMALRIIFSELSRIGGHLQNIKKFFLMSQQDDHALWLKRSFNQLSQVIEAYCGSSHFMHVNTIGGLYLDVPNFWPMFCRSYLDDLYEMVDDLQKSATRSNLWVDKINYGCIDKIKAIELGVTGPVLRATGVNYDLRKAAPYYFYSQLDFEIPLGKQGSIFDIYLVRVEEIRQSVKIIYQLLDNLPTDQINLGLLEQFTTQTLPERQTYFSIEGANGEQGFYVSSLNEFNFQRVYYRSPSFAHIDAAKNSVIGLSREQALLMLHSFNFVSGELEK